MLPYLLLATLYLAAIFPHCYFRHDDWLILGNAVFKVAENPEFLWQPTLFYGEKEIIWFFRPFFKGAVLLFYKAFGFNYYGWLAALFGLLLATLALTAGSIRLLTDDKARARWFVCLLALALPIHFGSTVWMGEGMMNIPQLFLLSVSLYLFLYSVQMRPFRAVALFLSVAMYVLSLGFKEAGIFHFGLLIALLWGEEKFDKFSFADRLLCLAPFALVTGAYLFFRFNLPMHESYLPRMKWYFFTDPFLRLVVFPALAVGLLALLRMFAGVPRWQKLVLYPGFFLACLVPYLGHGFFSVGWLLLPAYYFFLLLALSPRQWNLGRVQQAAFATAFGGISAVALGLFLYKVGWLQWEKPQRQIQAIIEAAPADAFDRMVVFECRNPQYPGADLNRVVGFESSFEFLWRLTHHRHLPALVAHCGENEANLRSYLAKQRPRELVLKWRFPNFEILRPEGNLLGRL